jgi:hypothetical protein
MARQTTDVDGDMDKVRESAADARAKARMYEEMADTAEYLAGLERVEGVKITDAGASVYLTVTTYEMYGTIKDMVSEFRIFGNSGTEDGAMSFTFEIEPHNFED